MKPTIISTGDDWACWSLGIVDGYYPSVTFGWGQTPLHAYEEWEKQKYATAPNLWGLWLECKKKGAKYKNVTMGAHRWV